MFKRKYKYMISIWYELDNKETRIRNIYLESNMKINKQNIISQIRLKIKEQIEIEERKTCNCIGIINWKKIK